MTSSTPTSTLTRELVALAWPAILQGLVTTVVLFTDRLLLGHYGTDELGSMGIAGPLVWTVFSLFGALGAGIVAVIGRAVGGRDRARAQRTLRVVLGFALCVGVGLAGATWAAREPLAAALAGTESAAAVRTHAVTYLGIVLVVAPLNFVGIAASSALHAAGDTRAPMIASVVGGALNLALTWTLVYGHLGLPELGIRGAAIGTAVAFSSYGAIVLLALRLRHEAPTLRSGDRPTHPVGAELGSAGEVDAAPPGRGEAAADAAKMTTRRAEALATPSSRRDETATTPWLVTLRPVLRVAAPTLGEKVLYHGAYMVFVAMIGHLGDVALAAHQTLIAIEAIGFTAADGVGVAAGALVAQKLGQERPGDAERVGWLAVATGTSGLLVVSLAFLIWPEHFVALFTDDPEVVALGAQCLRVAAIAQPLMAITDALAGALRGAGETRTPMIAALVGPVVVRLSACWILAYPMGLGLLGIWIGSTMDWGTRSVWLVRAFRRGHWKSVSIGEDASQAPTAGASSGAAGARPEQSSDGR